MSGFVLFLYFGCVYIIETIFRYNLLNPRRRVEGRVFLRREFGFRLPKKPSADMMPREEYPDEEEYNAVDEAGENCVVEEESDPQDEYNEEYPVEDEPMREYDTVSH